MRVGSIERNRVYSVNSTVRISEPKKVSTIKNNNFVSFTGVGKNLNQIASFTPENKGLGLPETALGGEGDVGYELIDSLRKHERVDARSFMPFWEHNNPKGGYKFLIHKKSEFPNGVSSLPDTMPASAFYSANYGETIDQVAKKLKIAPNELSYVIQSKPDGLSPNSQSKYCILEPTSVKGSVKRMSDTVLGEIEEIPYVLFKVSKHNPSYNKIKQYPNYFVYTKQLAKAAKPYSYDSWGNGPFEAEIINSDWMRIQAQLNKGAMDTPEFEHFNPANVLAHDRVAHPFAVHLSNLSARGESAVNGIKTHLIEHNPGRNYQGLTDDPFKMLTLVADEKDIEELKNHPSFYILRKAHRVGINNQQELSPREREITWKVLEPYLRPFRDSEWTYNVIKSGLAASKVNPQNITVGTVSHTFDKEMKSMETPEIARGLTSAFGQLETKSVLNGMTPGNMRFDEVDVNFGRGGNGLSENRTGFTPFKYNGKNIEQVVKAKEKNAKWLTNLIWKAGKKGQAELNKLFFNQSQINEGQNVLGYLSPIKKGEVLFFGFGRADDQKGFPISTGGFLEYLKDESVPKELKLKTKMMLGAGLWDKNHPDYKAIVKDLEEIWALDGGIYKHNIMYVDGFTPNRFVACSHYGIFTSRREMCGITPIQSKAAGTPYITTATGGPVDYTSAKTGFLTDEAVELRPEHYGLSYEKNTYEEINSARVKAQSKQVAKRIKEAVELYVNDRASYIEMSKQNIEELVDWHNNSAYNMGKSANRRYLEDIFEIDKPFEQRNTNPLKRACGKFGKVEDEVEKIFNKSLRTSSTGRFALLLLSALFVVSGGYVFYKQVKKSQQPLNKVA